MADWGLEWWVFQRAVKITLPVKVKSKVEDLETGKTVAEISPSDTTFEIDFSTELARTLHIRPSGGDRRSVNKQEGTK